MGLGWQVTRGLFGATAAAGRQLGGALAENSMQRQMNRGSRAIRRGLIGPWDSIPAGSQDFLDYSGLARPQDLASTTWSFPLGQYVMPRSTRLNPQWRSEFEIGISLDTANRHSVVYAPTQSGKTTSIVAPWIYSAMQMGYLVVAPDLKGNGDLVSKVAEYAAFQGSLPDVAITNFDYTHPGQSVSWNWIRGLNDESAIESAAQALVGRDRENDPNREFRLRDLKWMRGLLEYAHESGQQWTSGTLLSMLDDRERFTRYINNAAPPRARNRLQDLLEPAEDYYTKVQFLTTYLEVLNTFGLNKVTQRSSLALERVTDEPGLIVVTAPLADGKLADAVKALFVSQFLNVQLRNFNRVSRPVLLVLDEAPRLKDSIDLAQLTATAASSGMSVLLALQEVNAFEEKERDAILSNCLTHILMPGAGAPTTDYFGKRLGTRVATRYSRSENFDRRNGRTIQSSSQNQDVPVLGRNEMAVPPGGTHRALVHSYALSSKPILVDLERPDLMSSGGA